MSLELELGYEEMGEMQLRHGCVGIGVGGSEAERVLTWKPQISLQSRGQSHLFRGKAVGTDLSVGGR